MTDRDLLEAILLKLGNLETWQSKLQEGQAKLQEGQSKLQEGQAKLQEGQANLQEGQEELRSDVQGLQTTILKIEEIIHDKVGILFDADTRTQEKLERIETKLDVLEMEAASIRRIK